MEIEMERMRQGKRERERELDSIDLHSIQNHVQHSAHMAPLNVARLEYVCVFACLCVSILDLLVGV